MAKKKPKNQDPKTEHPPLCSCNKCLHKRLRKLEATMVIVHRGSQDLDKDLLKAEHQLAALANDHGWTKEMQGMLFNYLKRHNRAKLAEDNSMILKRPIRRPHRVLIIWIIRRKLRRLHAELLPVIKQLPDLEHEIMEYPDSPEELQARPDCPECGEKLIPVLQHPSSKGLLSPEEWNERRPGDWYCSCQDFKEGLHKRLYFFNEDLPDFDLKKWKTAQIEAQVAQLQNVNCVHEFPPVRCRCSLQPIPAEPEPIELCEIKESSPGQQQEAAQEEEHEA